MRQRLYQAGAVGLGATLLALGAAGRVPFGHSAHTTHPATRAALTVPGTEGGATLLFNGWRISPAGRQVATEDMLLGGAFSPDGTLYAVSSGGFGRHALHVFDVQTEKLIVAVPLGHAWNGLAWASDGQKIYVGGGISSAGNDVQIVEKTADGWSKTGSLHLTGNAPKQTYVAGLALSPDGSTLYALNVSDGKLYILDTATGATKATLPLGDHPIQCRLTDDGQSLLVAVWGGKELVRVTVSDPNKPIIAAHYPTGEHPNEFVIGSDGRLFVSCANSDAVYIHDARTGAQTEIVRTTLTPKSPSGSNPDALALAPDGKTLYVANADNNAVCVIDTSQPGRSQIAGFLPTGWYPTSVAVTPDGKRVLIGSGKGNGSQPNPGTVKPVAPVVPSDYKFAYIGSQLHGFVAWVDAPAAPALARYTRQVIANAPYRDSQLIGSDFKGKTAVPTRVGQKSPIQHVLYIIKENRTYDQVFGDLKQGNGDAALTLFGRDVTPNHHALAEQFVLLDNLYCNGEVSVDGHQWSDGGIATDFIQRTWTVSYSGKGDAEDSDNLTVPHNGYLWDACQRKGLTFRSYGEQVTIRTDPDTPPSQRGQATGATALAGHVSDAYAKVKGSKGAPYGRDTDKADVFIAEFREYEKKNAVPNFMVMSLGEDHTNGTRPGTFTPKAAVASNDQALGKIVEAISHSSVWKNTAIFVIEDDAQNGPDHVDSHRTAGLVISPYTKRKAVDSTMYSTASMLRTMELLLGLPPLTQYDASATPMFASFTNTPDLSGYRCLAPRIDVSARNPERGIGAALSSRMNFAGYDHLTRRDEDNLNRLLWHSIKGANTPYPAPVRSVFLDASRVPQSRKRANADRDGD